MDEPRGDEWDFFPFEVDGVRLSSFVNLRYMEELPSEANAHLFRAYVEMLDPGPNGMGTQRELDRFAPIEDAVAERVARAGAESVGRIRGDGVWQICVHGPAHLPLELWLRELVGEDVEVASEHDPEFAYLNDVLLPDDERYQWIVDRRLCQEIAKTGEDLSVPRPVDHFIDCDGDAPDGLADAIRALGFEVAASEVGLECTKVHPIDLETAHAEAMSLFDLAAAHGVSYGGWGAPLVSQGPIVA